MSTQLSIHEIAAKTHQDYARSMLVEAGVDERTIAYIEHTILNAAFDSRMATTTYFHQKMLDQQATVSKYVSKYAE